ncbi:MAG: SUMF1/EgtB/PvdO family nonheme iron enzyme [Chitinispirillaceae bacterium]|nr:SUMF1/EgtB/PvdO family nonheme iron enzyme [Chitinispirillaceae bacterium]
MNKQAIIRYVTLLCAVWYVAHFRCVPRDNPYDPANPGFIMPQFSCMIHLRDEVTTTDGVEHATIVFLYDNRSDTVIADSGSSVDIMIADNIAGNKIIVRIICVEAPTHQLNEPFDVTLSREGRDTTVLLHNRSVHSVPWDTIGTHTDTDGVCLVWHASNADQFKYYRVIRKHLASSVIDTLAENYKKQDTVFYDRTVEENEIYKYWVYAVSLDGISIKNNELTLTMPNRPPSPSSIDSIKADYFTCLRIYWSENSDRDFQRYVVYRSVDSVAFDPVYTATDRDETDWLDTTIDEAARRYYYQLAIVDDGGLTSVGTIVSGVNRTTIERSLVYIHEGAFTMGRGGAGVPLNEQPARGVFLSSFLIDRYEVTVGQYASFLNDGNGIYYYDSMANVGIHRNGTIFSPDSSRSNHPMVWLSWSDADTFCKWSGGHLPTEAQWEKAARGGDMRLYPWGNGFYFRQSPPDYFLANYIAGYISADDSGYSDDGARNTAPVGNYASGVSPCGLYDLAGNVNEWCSDWYGSYLPSDTINPKGRQLGLGYVYRGGSFKNYPEELMATYRFRMEPAGRKDDLGCRCVYESY